MRLRCSSLHRWGEWGGGWGGGQFSRLWMKPVQQSTSLDGISSSLLQKSPYNIQTAGGPACPLQAGSAGLPVGAGFTKVTGHKPPWVPGFLWPEKALKGAGRFHGTVRLCTLGLSRVYNFFFFTVLTRLDVAGQDWRWRLTDHLGVTTYPVCSGRSEDAICPDYCTARAPFLPQPPQRETHGRKGCSHRNKHGEKKSVGFCANNEEKKQRRTRQRNEVWADITGVLHRA